MPRKLSYEDKLRRAETRELDKARRQQKAEEKKSERELKRQERAADVAVKREQLRYEKDVSAEAKSRTRKKQVASRKSKRAVRKVWRRLI